MGNSVRLVVVCVLFAAAACGGGSGNGTISGPPTSPSPSPGGDQAVACGALGLTVGAAPIVNGAECSSTRSAVVLLNIRDGNNFAVGACSGTIIAPRAILTAAHCVDENAAIVRVWLGSGAEIVAQSFVMHPTYAANPSTGLDVAVVKMAEDLPRTPIPLLTSRDAAINETAVIAGWGRDQNSVPSTLRAGTTTISAVNNIYLETLFSITASSICSGDSGGPLLLSQGGTWAVAAVSSAASVIQCNSGTNFFVRVRNSNVASFLSSEVPDAVRR